MFQFFVVALTTNPVSNFTSILQQTSEETFGY